MGILVVEDDIDINGLLVKILEKENYEVRSAYSGSEAKMCVEMFKFDLIILDLMLPGVAGENLIKEIRANNIVPIIVISAKESLQDRINVLKLGADDFIGKPFENEEVLARIEAQLRRYKKFSRCEENSKLEFGNIKLDVEGRRALVKDKEIQLTMREFAILELLMSNPNKVFTRANLFESVWENEFLGDDNTVNVHISNLRSKIARVDKEIEYIKTVWGIGFKLNDL
ncbi:MAG: response regulator transcription factor [Sarcina sp.]